MAYPLIRDATGDLLVEAKFKVELRIKWPVRLVHQPRAPVRILFADQLHFRTPSPARPVIVPLNLVFGDVAENTGAHRVTNGNMIQFATTRGANLGDEIPSNVE